MRFSLRNFWLLTLLVALLSLMVAYAQNDQLDPGNPATWFLTAGGWGVMTMLIINFLKANVMRSLRGFGTIVVSFVTAVGGAFLANTGLLAPLGINLPGSIGEVFVFGLTAFMASSGGWDTGKKLMLAARSK